MIDYKQANPDHTMDQFYKVLKELDSETWKVCLLFIVFLTLFHSAYNSFLFTQIYDAQSKNLKVAKAGPTIQRPVRLFKKMFVNIPLPPCVG